MKTYRYKVACRIRFWLNGQECLVDCKSQGDAFNWIDQHESSVSDWSVKLVEVKKSEFLKVPVYSISGRVVEGGL